MRDRSRMLLGAVALLLLAAACGEGDVAGSTTLPLTTTAPTTTAAPPTTPAPTTTTEPPPPTTTTSTEPPQQAWSAVEAEKTVINYLAALAAGAYEQAAWSAHGNGVMIDGQADDETPAQALERLCADGACRGPYLVEADGPGFIDPMTAQAASTVTVTHAGSGTTGIIRLGTFEGQRIIAQLPPLVPSDGEPSLVEQLFGEDIPDRVVVQRFNAFEIWEGGSPTWVTHWHAGDVYEVEGDIVAARHAVVSLLDPQVTYEGECPKLMDRNGQVLILDRCYADSQHLFDPVTGDEQPIPAPVGDLGDGAYHWYEERFDTVLQGFGDAEGNLTNVTRGGLDMLGDDYAGFLKLSVDGDYVAYVDHRDPDSVNHFWSPVVVVKDTATGAEVGRWVLDNPVLCIEFAEHWVVACEASDSYQLGYEVDQRALVAIDITSGATTRVETPVYVFLPS